MKNLIILLAIMGFLLVLGAEANNTGVQKIRPKSTNWSKIKDLFR